MLNYELEDIFEDLEDVKLLIQQVRDKELNILSKYMGNIAIPQQQKESDAIKALYSLFKSNYAKSIQEQDLFIKQTLALSNSDQRQFKDLVYSESNKTVHLTLMQDNYEFEIQWNVINQIIDKITVQQIGKKDQIIIQKDQPLLYRDNEAIGILTQKDQPYGCQIYQFLKINKVI